MQISSATVSLLTTPLPTSEVEPRVLDAAQIAAEPAASDGSLEETSVETVEADEEASRHDGLTHRESKALLRDAEDSARRALHAYARENRGEDGGEDRHLMRDTKHALRDFRHEVRAAHRDLHHGEVDGEGFVAEVRTAFEGLATALGVTETPESQPSIEPAREEDAVAPAPVETEAQDPAAALREMMQALRERFDAVVGELESLLSVATEDEAPTSELEAFVQHYEELELETAEDVTGSVVDLEA